MAIIIQELTDEEMLRMMANENLEECGEWSSRDGRSNPHPTSENLNCHLMQKRDHHHEAKGI